MAVLLRVPAVVAEPSAAVLATLARAQEHLLPSEPGAPGAREIRALEYLRFVLADKRVDAEERELLLAGAASLDRLSLKVEGADFIALDAEGRERVLQRMIDEPHGELWISTLIVYLLEALLCAPAYGGNPEAIGWHWLEHRPGFPLPDTDHIYPKLAL